MRGRRPKPTALKRALGNPGKRRLNDLEPQPDKRIPPCPAFLDDEAKRLWNELGDLLLANGVLSEMDGLALATLCQTWSRWKFAEEQLRKYGPIVLSPDKKFPIQSPYLAIANKSIEQIHKLIVEFGMTPSSRSRVEAILRSGPSDLEQFLEKGRQIRQNALRSAAERAKRFNELAGEDEDADPSDRQEHESGVVTPKL